MRVQVGQATFGELHEALSDSKTRFIAGAERKLDYLAMLSQYSWVGKVDRDIVCAFGVIPPSVLSTRAYLWSVTTDKVEEHKFIFVRYSQRMIELIHREFPIIVGHTDPQNTRSIRWLRWLGATFGELTEKGLPFTIERKGHGA